MDNLKEMDWIISLHNSSACKDIKNLKISAQPLCKKDFERLVGASENSKSFNEWFKKLEDLNIFSFVGIISKNIRGCRHTKGYIVNGGKLIKYSKKNPKYLDHSKYYNLGTLISV